MSVDITEALTELQADSAEEPENQAVNAQRLKMLEFVLQPLQRPGVGHWLGADGLRSAAGAWTRTADRFLAGAAAGKGKRGCQRNGK